MAESPSEQMGESQPEREQETDAETPSAEKSLVEHFEETCSKNDATFVVYYRGVWWPYCKNYLKEFNQLLEEFKQLNVTIFGVCAQEKADVDKAVQSWELNYSCFSDPTHTLNKHLQEKFEFAVKVSGGEGSTDSSFYKVHPTIKQYKYGVAQPGVLCVNREGKKLYSWAIDPSFMNLGGATDRPVPVDIWKYIKGRITGENTSEVPPSMRKRGKLSLFWEHLEMVTSRLKNLSFFEFIVLFFISSVIVSLSLAMMHL